MNNIYELDKLTMPIVRTGEQQFAVICRERSGVESGTICPTARVFEIEELCDQDQKDIVSSALILADMCISRCRTENRKHLDHLFDRIANLSITVSNTEGELNGR